MKETALGGTLIHKRNLAIEMHDKEGAHASHPVYKSVLGVRVHAKLTKSGAQ